MAGSLSGFVIAVIGATFNCTNLYIYILTKIIVVVAGTCVLLAYLINAKSIVIDTKNLFIDMLSELKNMWKGK